MLHFYERINDDDDDDDENMNIAPKQLCVLDKTVLGCVYCVGCSYFVAKF